MFASVRLRRGQAAPIPQSNPYHEHMTPIDGKIEYDYLEFGEFG
jgi:hypothetical protein